MEEELRKCMNYETLIDKLRNLDKVYDILMTNDTFLKFSFL